jgi:hypothetical protein
MARHGFLYQEKEQHTNFHSFTQRRPFETQMKSQECLLSKLENNHKLPGLEQFEYHGGMI